MSNKSFNYILEAEYNCLDQISKELVQKAGFRILQSKQNSSNRIVLIKTNHQTENKLAVYYDEGNKNISIQIDLIRADQECLAAANDLIKLIKKAMGKTDQEMPKPVFIIPLKKIKKEILVESLCG